MSLNGGIAFSIQDCIIEIVHRRNSSGKTMALVSNQLLRESSTMGTRKGKGGQGVALATLLLPCAYCIEIRDPHLLECSGFINTPAGIA